MSSPPVNRYKPGTGFRSFWTGVSGVTGQPADPTAPTATLFLPDGSTVSGSPIQLVVGSWYADFLIPITCRKAGPAYVRWRSAGSTPLEDNVSERPIDVQPLAA